MSTGPLDPPRAEPIPVDSARALFDYEVRRDGRVVAQLRAVQSPGGVTVETEVYPVGSRPTDTPVVRPFTFASPDQAQRFADEALTALEYLNCTVVA